MKTGFLRGGVFSAVRSKKDRPQWKIYRKDHLTPRRCFYTNRSCPFKLRIGRQSATFTTFKGSLAPKGGVRGVAVTAATGAGTRGGAPRRSDPASTTLSTALIWSARPFQAALAALPPAFMHTFKVLQLGFSEARWEGEGGKRPTETPKPRQPGPCGGCLTWLKPTFIHLRGVDEG